MWESIEHVLNGNSGAYIVTVITVICALLISLSKSGGFSIHTSAISLGNMYKEREIIRHQVEVAYAASSSLLMDLGADMDNYRTKYIVEKVYDKAIEWIVFNHITPTPIYIDAKVTALYNMVRNLNVVTDDSIDVHGVVTTWVTATISQLVHVREYYTRRHFRHKEEK